MVRPIKEFKIDCWRFKMDIAKNREEVPHQWTADYEQAYKNAGLDPVIHGMQQLLPKQKMGGATHLIYASLTNTSFKVR